MPVLNLRQCKVVEVIDEARNVRTLKCRPTDGKPFTHKPGQFVMIYRLDEVGSPKDGRAYSIPSPPSQPFDVTFKVAGEFTRKLMQVKEGELLGFTGPFGFFTPNENSQQVVMLAGGIGITPFMSVLRDAKEKPTQRKLTLIYSNRTVEDIAFRKELEEMDGKVARIVLTVTRPHESQQQWNGLVRRIDAETIKENVQDFSNAEYFLCGSPDFVKGVEQTLHAMGVAKEKIKEEKF